MDQDQSSSVSDAAHFDSTRWTVVLEAAQSRAPGGPEALARLCARSWQPLYGFARRRGYGPEDAQDLVQGFLAHLIERRALRRVERSKGRFRSFLLASFQKFMANETRRAGAEKRGGRAEVLPMDWQDEEHRLRIEPPDPLTPETLYDARWAVKAGQELDAGGDAMRWARSAFHENQYSYEQIVRLAESTPPVPINCSFCPTSMGNGGVPIRMPGPSSSA